MVGLSQPGTRQKYHRISESESIAHVKVAVEPTTMTAFDEVVVIPPSTIYKLRGSTVRTYCGLGLTENCVWRQANANGVFRKFWIQSFWICKTSYTSSHTYSFIVLGCGLTTYNKDFDDDGLVDWMLDVCLCYVKLNFIDIYTYQKISCIICFVYV